MPAIPFWPRYHLRPATLPLDRLVARTIILSIPALTIRITGEDFGKLFGDFSGELSPARRVFHKTVIAVCI